MPTQRTDVMGLQTLLAADVTAGTWTLPSPVAVVLDANGFPTLPNAGSFWSGVQVQRNAVWGPNDVVSLGQNLCRLGFIGQGAEGATFSAIYLGWALSQTAAGKGLWMPFSLLALDGTLGTVVGVNGTDVTAAYRFASTLAVSGGGSVPSFAALTSPGAGQIALLTADMLGFAACQALLKVGTATAVNSLYARL